MDNIPAGLKKSLLDVVFERGKQDGKWGEQNHSPDHWLAILMEEIGEMTRSNLDRDRANYRAELVQVAAVALAMIESLDRGIF